jgi:hypothetical protein
MTMQIITREAAKAKGLKRYYTGKPCLRGHASARLVSSHGCRVCENARQRGANRTRHSGITPEIFSYLWREQEGRCAVCGMELDRSRLKGVHADHCHDTKQPRGLLCPYCNLSEGVLKKKGLDPEEWGRRLAAYLKQPPYKDLTDLV